MKVYGTNFLHWVFIGRWYFKDLIKDYTQDDLLNIWNNVKHTRPDDIVRRDIGRIIINASERLIKFE